MEPRYLLYDREVNKVRISKFIEDGTDVISNIHYPIALPIGERPFVAGFTQPVQVNNVTSKYALIYAKDIVGAICLLTGHPNHILPEFIKQIGDFTQLFFDYKEKPENVQAKELMAKLNTNKSELSLTVRAFNCLGRAKINTVKEILEFPVCKMMNIPDCGKSTVELIGAEVLKFCEMTLNQSSKKCQITEENVLYVLENKEFPADPSTLPMYPPASPAKSKTGTTGGIVVREGSRVTKIEIRPTIRNAGEKGAIGTDLLCAVDAVLAHWGK